MGDITREKVEYIMKGISTKFRGSLKPNQEQTFRLFSTVVQSSGSAEDYDWLNDIADLREWVGGRVLEDLSSSVYSIRNRKFERTIRVKADDIRDDKTGHYSTQAEMLAASANRWEEGLAVEALTSNGLCYDGQNFFDTDHVFGGTTFSNDNPSLGSLTGSATGYIYLMDTSKLINPIIVQERQAPSTKMLTNPDSDHVFKYDEFLMGVDARGAAGYSFPQTAMRFKAGAATFTSVRNCIVAARASAAAIKNDEGQKLGIRYNTVLCGAAEETIVKQAVNAQYIDDAFTPNVLYGSVNVVVVDRL